jgi:hypothetical protein
VLLCIGGPYGVGDKIREVVSPYGTPSRIPGTVLLLTLRLRDLQNIGSCLKTFLPRKANIAAGPAAHAATQITVTLALA